MIFSVCKLEIFSSNHLNKHSGNQSHQIFIFGYFLINFIISIAILSGDTNNLSNSVYQSHLGSNKENLILLTLYFFINNITSSKKSILFLVTTQFIDKFKFNHLKLFNNVSI
jgi:hypothetical protein